MWRGPWNQEASSQRIQGVLAIRRFQLQPIHKAHNRETLRATGQLTSAGPSPHRRHHLDMHAIERMEKSAHRVQSSLNLFSFGFEGGWVPKSLISRGLIWVLVLLDADSHCEKSGGSIFHRMEPNMADRVDISHIPRAPWEPGWEVILVTRF